jgi:hypothetical protein
LRRALVAYVLDAPLYVAVAVFALGLCWVIGFFVPTLLGAPPMSAPAGAAAYDFKLGLIGTVVTAFVNAVVYVGVLARDSGVKRTWRSTLDRAFEVMWALIIVDLFTFAVQALTVTFVLGSPDQTGYGFFAVPVLIIWTALIFPEAAAAMDDTPSLRRVPTAFVNGFGAAFGRENFGRLVLIAALTQVPINAVAFVLQTVFLKNPTPASLFWVEIPWQLLTTGIVAAIVGVAYRDMRLRMSAATKNR